MKEEYIIVKKSSIDAFDLVKKKSKTLSKKQKSFLDQPSKPWGITSQNDVWLVHDLSFETAFLTYQEAQRLKETEPTVIDTLRNVTLKHKRGNLSQSDAPAGLEAFSHKTVLDSSCTGHGIKVGILDTGIDKEHNAFSGIKFTEKDFTSSNKPNIAPDDDGHGTHCAGIFFGRDIGPTRIGVARGVSHAMVGKVFKKGHANTTLDTIINGLTWANEQGAQIISLSAGPSFVYDIANACQSTQEKRLVEIAKIINKYNEVLFRLNQIGKYFLSRTIVDKGSLVFIAAGHESDIHIQPPLYIQAFPPRGMTDFLVVGAARPNDEIWEVSNILPDLIAPGFEILSAWPGNKTEHLDGTSQATPYAAGIATLWAERLIKKSKHGKLDLLKLRKKLLEKCNFSKISPRKFNTEFFRGHGAAYPPK